MKSSRIFIPLQEPAQSLCWAGDRLVDWINGGITYGLDGTVSGRPDYYWAFHFDAAVQSASGRYSAVYERYGTKALLLDRGKLLRELNRSFYWARAYEYPIALFESSDGQAMIAHCPDEYHRIEIDDVATGNRLTAANNRAPDDFFHSRLASSPRGTRLLSAGWFWHPEDSVCAWSIAEALAHPQSLDRSRMSTGFLYGMSSATFLDESRVLVSSSEDEDDEYALPPEAFPARSLGVFNLDTASFESIVKTDETVGTMMWLGDSHVIGFFRSPRVFNVATGRIVDRWADLATGTQTSSIKRDTIAPVLACDPAGKRFAVASTQGIDVVCIE